MALSAIRRGRCRCVAVNELKFVDVLAEFAGLGVTKN